MTDGERSPIDASIRLLIVESEQRIMKAFEDWRHGTFGPHVRLNAADAEDFRVALAERHSDHEAIKEIRAAIYGNGKPGLKQDMVTLTTTVRTVGVVIGLVMPILTALIQILAKNMGLLK